MTRALAIVVGFLFAAPLAAQTAGKTDAPQRSVADILRDTKSPQFQTRRRAVLACRGRHEPALVERLQEVARRDRHPNIREWAIDALAETGDVKLVPFIKERLSKDPSLGPKRSALLALGKLPAPGNIEILSKRLLQALVDFDSKRGVEVLFAFWKTPEAKNKRFVIARTLETQETERVRKAMLAELDAERERATARKSRTPSVNSATPAPCHASARSSSRSRPGGVPQPGRTANHREETRRAARVVEGARRARGVRLWEVAIIHHPARAARGPYRIRNCLATIHSTGLRSSVRIVGLLTIHDSRVMPEQHR